MVSNEQGRSFPEVPTNVSYPEQSEIENKLEGLSSRRRNSRIGQVASYVIFGGGITAAQLYAPESVGLATIPFVTGLIGAVNYRLKHESMKYRIERLKEVRARLITRQLHSPNQVR